MSRALIPGSSPLFEGLSDREVDQVADRLRPEPVEPGQVILRQHELGHSLFIVRSGVIEVRVESADGAEVPVARLTRGDCLGEMSLLTGRPRSATAVALSEGLLLRLSQPDFLWLVTSCPSLSLNLARVLSERLLARNRQDFVKRAAGQLFGLIERPRCAPGALGAYLAHAVATETTRAVALVDLHGGPRPAAHRFGFRRLPRLVVVGQRGRPATPIDGRAEVWATRSERFGSGGARPDDLVAALGWLRERFDYVFLSMPRSAVDAAALTRPDRLLAEIAPSEGVADVPPGAELLVVAPNRVPTLGDSRRAASRLGHRPIHMLPVSEDALGEAGLAGAPDPPGGDRSPFRRGLGRLARSLGGLTVGVALGAGGAKGYAHLGVLRVLERAGVPIDFLAGSSIGAIVGAARALGCTLDEVEAHLREQFNSEAVGKLFTLSLSGTSTAGAAELDAILGAMFGERVFDDLQVPLLVMAVDLETRREAALRGGLLREAVRASAAQPGTFPPVVLDGHTYVDGVVLSPVPTTPLEAAGASVVIGVNLFGRDQLPAWPSEDPVAPKVVRVPQMLDNLFKTVEIMQVDTSERLMRHADVPITPLFGPGSWRDFHRADQFLAAGEAATEAALPRLRGLLPGLPA